MAATKQIERRIIGRNIRALRELKEIAQTEAANKCGIERTYYIDIENGTANVTFEKYERIAAFLGVRVRDLFADNAVTTYAQSSVPKAKRRQREKVRA